VAGTHKLTHDRLKLAIAAVPRYGVSGTREQIALVDERHSQPMTQKIASTAAREFVEAVDALNTALAWGKQYGADKVVPERERAVEEAEARLMAELRSEA
jgi:hypothetical protein